jgi:hypothetical protein
MGHNPKLAMQQQGPVQLNQQTCQSRSKTHQLKTVHRSKRRPLMPALGQERTSPAYSAMSALPPKADKLQTFRDVRFVPEADITRRTKLALVSAVFGTSTCPN